ncbi:MAG: hypothetical protein LUE98_04650, partial [Tannerellaceae bacterium]|nr:hypothetical protein [Tannerellaceae bacterium]
MIFKPMTQQQWEEWKKRADAWLKTNLKNHKKGVDLILEIYQSNSFIERMKEGEAKRYKAKLTEMIRQVAVLTKYPRIIDTPEKRDKLYIASVPYKEPEASLPEYNKKEDTEIGPYQLPAEWLQYAEFDTYKD